jgi:Uroporphyrinogen decarboxylase (URO-D)
MDVFDPPVTIFSARAYETLDYRLYKWPGQGLPADSSSFQYVEGEYMKADEYEAFLNNPTEFWQRVLMPRAAGSLEALRNLPPWNPQGVLPMGWIMALGRKDMQASFQAMFKAGEEALERSRAVRELRFEALTAGLPTLRTGFSSAPFDILGDTLRGTQGIILDMYRQPDKILAALEKITPVVIESALSMANASECPIISFPLHKGEDSIMSQKQFETFYWPTFRRVLLALISEGVVPYVFAEGRYNTRLDTIKEMPRGSMIWWFEGTDMEAAKKTVGKNACISGNIPVSLLLEVAGKGGGFILNGAAFMNRGDPSVLAAMMEAAKEYGRYL